MKKLRHHLRDVLLPALAIVCTVSTLFAQDQASGPDELPPLIGRKQAAELALTQPWPEYPPVAKANDLEGPVQLEIVVNDKGNVVYVHVLDGNAILAAAAVKATRRWTYLPLATTAGPSGFVTTVQIKFVLQSHGKPWTSRQAEQDFLRQVRPPEMLSQPETAPPEVLVHMRVLVNDLGKVVDKIAPPMGRAQFEIASETLRRWTFRPAHWGNLPVAAYLDVNVPISEAPITRTAANLGSR